MLKHLTIRNYALIRHLELDPSEHLNVITGETGAGKSIILGAVGLLLGNRADSKTLWNEEEKCIIEGTFFLKPYRLKNFFKSEDLDYDEMTVIRRELSPGGKSRAFINDTPVTLDTMKKLGTMLMDIHSQHETLQLANLLFQIQLIDAFAGNDELLEQYRASWNEYVDAKKAFEELEHQAQRLREESEYINFQLAELEKVALQPNELPALESELKVMEHSEEIKTKLRQSFGLLTEGEYAILEALREVRVQLQSIASYAPSYEKLLERLESLRLELEDLSSEVEQEDERIEFDPNRIEIVKSRLSAIYNLLKKHRVGTVEELLGIQEKLAEKALLTNDLDGALKERKTVLDRASKTLQSHAAALSAARKKSFQPLVQSLTKLLAELGMPDASLQIDWSEIAAGSNGADRVEILFSANKGISPKPLAQVASGGEFSRLMFAIKYVMAGKTAIPTLILDEIDTGISGEIAVKLGEMMNRMARKHQLITITHSPQIAAKGDSHYYVFKDNSEAKTISNIRLLSPNERVEEIAKMIGGAKPSKVALENAQELLAR